ncbi:MAG: C10 family peptidase [candidate division Zixibacteria bacterium]|nr:C10 family peptidase [candidate division Zixibacteria bacterium]MDH3938910.1 C10 family peptidase [candidate division Zixibacteria bacterium]MDH4034760.1 C10 family peptidase [candidate division Zixibacteria bacterium]
MTQRFSYRILCLSFTACLVIGLAATTLAERATVLEADMVSQNWLSYIVNQKGDWAGNSAPEISRMEEIMENDTLVGYLYHIKPTGYIVVPLLKELAPVKVTSEENGIDITEQGGMAALIREGLIDAVRAFDYLYGNLDASLPPTGEVSFGREYRAQWDRYAVTADEFESSLKNGSRDTLVSVGPLLTSRWHQGYPYNMYCPQGDGGQCVVGCVATATAMILDYHEWPPFGVDSVRYFWNGDQSCNGNSPGEWLVAHVDDQYDWPNIPDHAPSYALDEVKAAVAELNVEVAIAYWMHFGKCGSGSYVTHGHRVFPEVFRYRDSVVQTDRPGITAQEWFEACHEDIDLGRPITYRITSHNIVLDGYRVVDGINQQHFNYGWNSSHTTWYTVDYVYCPWEGCSPGDQMMLTKIIPDRSVMFTVDTSIGWLPLTVEFSGSSDLEVDNWIYDFGDGDTSRAQQTSVHTYDTPGCYDVCLEIQAGADTCSLVRPQLVIAIADTITAESAGGAPDSTAVLIINARNSAPLKELRIPVEYAGEANLTYDSCSTIGCRTEYFEIVDQIQFSPAGKRMTMRLLTTNNDAQPDLSPGAGPVLKLFFSVEAAAVPGQSVSIELDGYNTYLPGYFGRILDYQPETSTGSIDVVSCCTGHRGNIDGDPANEVTISDLIYLVDYMFSGGPAPSCPKAADINGSLNLDVSDLIFLVDYMFTGGYPPLPCW